jgi:hypothetical protein
MFVPSSGYIDTRNFSDIESLGLFLNQTRYNEEQYLSYFSWKKDYFWGIGHFFTPFCDLCLRLYLDEKIRVIENIQSWWFNNTCHEFAFVVKNDKKN